MLTGLVFHIRDGRDDAMLTSHLLHYCQGIDSEAIAFTLNDDEVTPKMCNLRELLIFLSKFRNG